MADLETSDIWQLLSVTREPAREVDRKRSATVMRTEADGTIWVQVAGNSDQTPVTRSSATVEPGDVVDVEIANGKATILGNTSNPSAQTTRVDGIAELANQAVNDAGRAALAAASAEASAEAAQVSATAAQESADQAISDAADAAEAASAAQADATAAGQAATAAMTAATGAQADAAAAQASATAAGNAAAAAQLDATTANNAANGALMSLSTVQDVIGVLDWARENATYTLTSDTSIQPGKVYWTRSGAGTAQNPYVYDPVANPTESGLPTYYEISGVDEAMADFISSHLALTDEGLWVLKDGSSYRTLLASDGMEVVTPSGSKLIRIGHNATGLTEVMIEDDILTPVKVLHYVASGEVPSGSQSMLDAVMALSDNTGIYEGLKMYTGDPSYLRFEVPTTCGTPRVFLSGGFTYTDTLMDSGLLVELNDIDSYELTLGAEWGGVSTWFMKTIFEDAFAEEFLGACVTESEYKSLGLFDEDGASAFSASSKGLSIVPSSGASTEVTGDGLYVIEDGETKAHVGPGTAWLSDSVETTDVRAQEVTATTSGGTVHQLTHKQDRLVSGTNIKTINHESLLGSGNIDVAGGVTGVKGAAEDAYRTGDVELDEEDIGIEFLTNAEISTMFANA